jgi:hypothetical protein
MHVYECGWVTRRGRMFAHSGCKNSAGLSPHFIMNAKSTQSKFAQDKMLKIIFAPQHNVIFSWKGSCVVTYSNLLSNERFSV